ncbi:NAD(P)-binding protein [Clavulina sp. PMI_390]|nr:NAD(P)-binding protein [Clavulina sp. PMI_390]
MASLLGFVSRNYQSFFPATTPKESNALKFGILGAAQIAPVALIVPARTHPDVIIEAVAARDHERAKKFAKKHGIPKTYPSYQELLDDASIDVVYIPLPNTLHYEWTVKALRAGKHVLLEKPATNTRAEAEKLYALAREKNLVLLEAFHYRFHPAIQTVKQIVASGAIGKIVGVEADLAFPPVVAPPGNIRRNFDMGGGATMDAGGYTTSVSRYVLGAEPDDVLHIQLNTYPEDRRNDRSMRVVFSFPSDATAAIYCDLGLPNLLYVLPRPPLASIKVDGTEGSVYLNNFIVPSFWHYIEVTKGKKDKAKKTYQKAYTFEGLDQNAKGDASWTSYRYQLEAFVDKVRGRTPQTWVSEEETLGNMSALEMIYDNSGLGLRPASTFE